MIAMAFVAFEPFVGFPKIKMGGLSRLLRKSAHTLPMLAKPLWQMAHYDVYFPRQPYRNAIIQNIFAIFLQSLIGNAVVVDEFLLRGMQ